MEFSSDFVWGVSTASYQIEGAWNEDGKGESIWDRFSHIPGKVLNGDTGDVACDHFHRYEEDIELMQSLGVQAYSLSVSWPRVVPGGPGDVEERGIAFYQNLVQRLTKAGIKPFVTLYHWDLPQSLQNRGGWANREVTDAFERYAAVVFRELGEYVDTWITHTEPVIITFNGHWAGSHAPGHTDFSEALQASHNLLLAHGKAVATLRSINPQAKIGIKNLCPMLHPASDSSEDRAACHRQDGMEIRWFLDPLFKGAYPADMIDWFTAHGVVLPNMMDSDLETISQPIDFMGFNYYTTNLVSYDRNAWPLQAAQVPITENRTKMNWAVWPQGMYESLMRVHRDYGGVPMYVTENGAAFDDTLLDDGTVNDLDRISFLESHVDSVQRAASAGADIRGYFVWSLLDNFEWDQGYDRRFGLTYVDYDSLARIPKKSFRWYRNLIDDNSADAT